MTSNPRRGSDVNFTSFANARRDFLWPVPVTLKAGLDFHQTTRDNQASSYSWTYRGSTTPGSAAPFLDAFISQRVGPYGFPRMQFADYKGTLDYFRANPSQFTLNEDASYRAGVNASKHMVEAISAGYLRGDVALLERQARVTKEYLRLFPSLNASYHLREDLIGSWGVSLTRPRFNVRLNVSLRAAQRLGSVTGAGIDPGTYNYTPARNTVDVLGEYKLWREFAVFANLRNVGDVPDEGTTVGPTTPSLARLRTRERYGSLWTIGLKGTF